MPRRVLLCLGMAAMLATAGPARAEHLLLQTPPDWTVTTLPAPEEDGHPTAGERRRAILPGPNGRPLAAIEVVELPQTSDNTGRMSEMLQQAVAEASKGYATSHLENRCNGSNDVRVAGHPALRTDCTVFRSAQPVLGQVIVILVTPASLYAVTYSAGMAAFQTHEPSFRDALASARLQ